MHGGRTNFLEFDIKSMAEKLDTFICGNIISCQNDKIHLFEYKSGRMVRIVQRDVLSLQKIKNRAKESRIKYVVSEIKKIKERTAPILFMDEALVNLIIR